MKLYRLNFNMVFLCFVSIVSNLYFVLYVFVGGNKEMNTISAMLKNVNEEATTLLVFALTLSEYSAISLMLRGKPDTR